LAIGLLSFAAVHYLVTSIAPSPDGGNPSRSNVRSLYQNPVRGFPRLINDCWFEILLMAVLSRQDRSTGRAGG
jgi:hypothetical protein